MTYAEALSYLTEDSSRRVDFRYRDATRSFWITDRCWAEDGQVVRPHPTDLNLPAIQAPTDVEFKAVNPEELDEARAWADYQARIAAANDLEDRIRDDYGQWSKGLES